MPPAPPRRPGAKAPEMAQDAKALLECLLQARADPNAEDHQGQGLLALACGMPRLEVELAEGSGPVG